MTWSDYLNNGDAVGAVVALAPSEFCVAVVLLAGFSLVSFVGAFRYFRRARMIEDVPTSKIRSASQGYVELEGHAMPAPSHGQLLAPVSNRPCVWWDYKIEQCQKSDKGAGDWRTIDSGTSKAAFLIDDQTGRALVKPSGATTSISLSRTWHGSSPRPCPNPSGIASGTSLLGSYCYTERVILAGERLYALGHFQTERDGGFERNVLSRPEDRRPFILATKSQDRLTASLKSHAGSSLAASLASGAGLMWLLAARGLL